MGIIVKCSVFHLAGHLPVLLTALKMAVTGAVNAPGYSRTRLESGSPSTRDSVFFMADSKELVRSSEKWPRPPERNSGAGGIGREGAVAILP